MADADGQVEITAQNQIARLIPLQIS